MTSQIVPCAERQLFYSLPLFPLPNFDHLSPCICKELPKRPQSWEEEKLSLCDWRESFRPCNPCNPEKEIYGNVDQLITKWKEAEPHQGRQPCAKAWRDAQRALTPSEVDWPLVFRWEAPSPPHPPLADLGPFDLLVVVSGRVRERERAQSLAGGESLED